MAIYDGKIEQTPIDFHIWLALVAPRPVMVIGGTQRHDLPQPGGAADAAGSGARRFINLYGAKDALTWDIADAPHSFRDEAREKAYAMLGKSLHWGEIKGSHRDT